MRSRRAARGAIASGVVVAVAATTALTLSALVPEGTPWSPTTRLTVATDASTPSPRTTPVSRSDERGPAVSVTLAVDGSERDVVTTATDVTGLLVEQGVVLGDRAVSHDLDAPVVAGMRVLVVDVTWTHDTVEEELEPELVEVEDATLAAGERVVVDPGRPGRAVTTYLVASVDGHESSRSEVVAVVSREAVPGRVRVGTGTAVPASRPTSAPQTQAPAPTGAPSGGTGTGDASGGGAADDGGSGDGPGSGSGDGADAGDGAGGGSDGDGDETPAPDPTQAPEPAPSPTPTSRPTTAPEGTPGTTPASAKQLARTMVADRGWSNAEYRCLVTLWERESNWRYTAANPYSTARGIPQAIMSIHFGSDWRTNDAAARYLSTPSVQIAWGLSYIKGRYSGPCKALDHSDAKGWY